jgi:eukaryotic-like serine/threonine-protein kinase
MNERFREHLQEAISGTHSIEREITGGGMSRVFVATERALGRAVVVKVLRPDLAAGMNRERFRREIMLAAQLAHPHIVPVLSAGEHDDLIWYTMPFVEGESLREALASRGKFEPRQVVRTLHDVLDALSYAHKRGVIHRDIKPGNILTHGPHALVTDFGVAKALTAAIPQSGATSGGLAIGTPAYMAPEQLAADPNADHRMDLYAVGLLAYELLTGEQPFSGESPAATMAAQLTRMPEPIERARPDVPAPLAGVVMRLLAKQPDDRPPTAAAALEELEQRITPGSGSSASLIAASPTRAAPTAQTTVSERPRRSIAAPAFAGGAVLAAVAVAAILFARRDELRGPPTPPPSLMKAESLRGASESAKINTSLLTPPNESAGKRTASLIAPPKREATVGLADSNAGQSKQSSRASVPVPKPAPGANTRVTPPRQAAPLMTPGGRPRRVAVLPVTDATSRPQYASVARAIEDSLKRAATAAGYTLASDAELVRLLADNDQNPRRRTAEASGIGAVLSGYLTVSNRELQAQILVHDIWRNAQQAQRSGSELDDSTGTLIVVRDVIRALNRVSWRTRDDPHRVVVFDIENQTGIDSLSAVARAYSDSVRAAIRRSGAELSGDSAARATRETNDRRFVGLELGARAIVVAQLNRRGADSLRVRLTVRDMSEERNFETLEATTSLREPLGALPNVLQRLAADLARVNWGPKGAQTPGPPGSPGNQPPAPAPGGGLPPRGW